MSVKSCLQNPTTSKFWVSREIASRMLEGSISRCYGKSSESDNSGQVTCISHICLLAYWSSRQLQTLLTHSLVSSLFITIMCHPTLLLFLILPFHFLLLRATSISPSLNKVKLGCTGGVPEECSSGSIQRWLHKVVVENLRWLQDQVATYRLPAKKGLLVGSPAFPRIKIQHVLFEVNIIQLTLCSNTNVIFPCRLARLVTWMRNLWM
jgi:hypothetical protein